ncbi:peptidase domain-containing ABC transporter [Prochlorococcus sp. MIT 1303]|uniref:peptidase domain-containing ABC transporter n=1 Tax=Prochlorococcus sp. MIT 1303 TaxID=1723647 RepID=UPI0007B3912D|nr:peptidase domain-containing ABC transporter [Prochlorococcus sp. MIT 1303]KZR61811.1 Alpha-hemolysin translocation ATP-binding protein HlyB [Prochlorococcus sp. MIT 1303]
MTLANLNHPLAPLQNALQTKGERLKFQIGQSLCEENYLPGHVLLIESGTARLLGNSDGRLTTRIKLESGSLIGAVSLLRGASCEAVRAATELVAWSITDATFQQLYNSKKDIRDCCEAYLWDAEVAALLQGIRASTPKSHHSLEAWLKMLGPLATLMRANNDEAEAALNNGKRLFLASSIPSCPINTELDSIATIRELSKPQSGFCLRLIALPADSLATLLRPAVDSKSNAALQNDEETPETALSLAPSRPPVSSLNSPSSSEDFFVGGQGPLQETLACFQMLAKLMKLPFRRDSIEKMLRDSLRRGQTPTLRMCGQIAAGLGLHVAGAKVPALMGTRLQTPTLVPWKQSFALVTRSDQLGLTLASPSEGFIKLDPSQLEEAFPEGIELLLLDRSNTTPEQAFGPSWFWPALQRYRGVLIQVLIAGFVVQLFTLANPLLIQVIIDKVINQRSLDTLQILGFALVIVTVLEGVLGSLKTFLFAETTNRIDQRLGAEVIDHLLRLPLGYFDKRPVGELGSRVSELEKIRNFLTGQALTTILDAAFSVIYVVVMVIYSWLLTLIALAVLPIQVGLTLLGAPLFRRQFRQTAEENAKTQSHLVEVLTGIQTVKAQNVEMISRWKWQERYGRYISRSFEKTISGTALSQTSQVLQKISQLLVLWVGASMVLAGELTLGQLIAFRIISGYVTQPLLRLSTIWQSIQELRVSFERLADVIDTPQESNDLDKGKVPLPPLEGDVSFEDLSFSFSKSTAPVLKDINLNIKAGTFVGIVGQSGSGKSTLVKLLPRLYSPDQGRILIDGYDIDKVELYSLRRQIGIVPQDPLLFSGSISENIALTQPDADNNEIIMAAKLAVAHDFIMTLPSGYSTPVGERGSSLSGGQRQRIAIARTLLSNPKLLVMDEATSALDYETERKVCDNLVNAMHDCTVFFITHRLSTVRRADVIVVMHQGAIVEMGTHEALMEKLGRYYALYRQQESS